MSVAQSAFTAAVFDPARAAPDGLTDPQGRPAGKRFDVYRNNVVVSLMKAHDTAFPATAKVLGQDNFRRVAATYVRQHPPDTPLMMRFGAAFPAFLDGFAPLARYPWLGDLARLELAIRESYHAADATPVSQAALAALPVDRLLGLRLTFAPAMRLLRSHWPVLGLWRQQMQDGPAPGDEGEAVLITRPGFDPVPQPLPVGAARFVLALQAGHPLGAALDSATAAVPEFDLAATLALLIGGGTIIRLEDTP